LCILYQLWLKFALMSFRPKPPFLLPASAGTSLPLRRQGQESSGTSVEMTVGWRLSSFAPLRGENGCPTISNKKLRALSHGMNTLFFVTNRIRCVNLKYVDGFCWKSLREKHRTSHARYERNSMKVIN